MLNRQFNIEWTEKYALIAVDANPVCLMCNECLILCKEYNLRRHFNTMHANFNTTFPPGSAARRQISGLTFCYEQRASGMDIGKKEKAVYRLRDSQCMQASFDEVVT